MSKAISYESLPELTYPLFAGRAMQAAEPFLRECALGDQSIPFETIYEMFGACGLFIVPDQLFIDGMFWPHAMSLDFIARRDIAKAHREGLQNLRKQFRARAQDIRARFASGAFAHSDEADELLRHLWAWFLNGNVYRLLVDVCRQTTEATERMPPAVSLCPLSAVLACADELEKPIELVPQVDPAIVRQIAKAGGRRVLLSIHAWRLLRWLSLTCIEQHVRGVDDSHVINLAGGFQELGELVNGPSKSKNQGTRIKHALLTFAYGNFTDSEGMSGPLLNVRSGVYGLRRGELEIVLVPGIFKPSPAKRVLVPLVEPPEPVGSLVQYGRQATLFMDFVHAMARLGAARLRERGGVRLDLPRLAAARGVTRFEYVVDAWHDAGHLETEGSYTRLGPRHSREWRLLVYRSRKGKQKRGSRK